MAFGSHETLGMKLHAFGLAAAMADAHHFVFVGPRGDFEFRRNRVAANDEAVIASGFERIRHAAEHAFAVVMNKRRLAVHDSVVANDGAAENVAHALMAETHAEDRGRFRESANDFARNAGFGRRAWPGGNDDLLGFHGREFVDRRRVVADDFHFDLGVDLSDALHEVVSEAVVIVDEQDHTGSQCAEIEKASFAAPLAERSARRRRIAAQRHARFNEGSRGMRSHETAERIDENRR